MKKSQYKLKKYLPLTLELKNIIIGLLLGDLHLYINKSGTCYLKFEQGEVHYDYLMHLYNLFNIYVNTPPKCKIRGLNKNNKSIKSWYFNTTTVEAFKEFKIFYKNGKKIIPNNIDELLTPLGLAYWFQDDGNKKSNESKGIYLNTQNFSLKEVELLSSILKTKFNLNNKITKEMNK